MNSLLKNYKEYPFPFRFLISYILVTVVGIVLMDMLATWAIIAGITDFLDLLVAIIVELVAFVTHNELSFSKMN